MTGLDPGPRVLEATALPTCPQSLVKCLCHSLPQWHFPHFNILPLWHFLKLKMGHSLPLFLYSHLFNTFDSKQIFNINFANDWI